MKFESTTVNMTAVLIEQPYIYDINNSSFGTTTVVIKGAHTHIYQESVKRTEWGERYCLDCDCGKKIEFLLNPRKFIEALIAEEKEGEL